MKITNPSRAKKIDQVAKIRDKISSAKALVVVQYSGLSVKELQTLRKELKEKKVELQVFKNRLFKLATKDLGLESINSTLTGQNAFAFGLEDEIAPAKILFNFSKGNENLKLKSGIYEGKIVFEDEVKKIATLPSFEEAIGMLANQLISPIRYISFGLNKLVTENKIKD